MRIAAAVAVSVLASGASAQSARFEGSVQPICTVKTMSGGAALSSELAVFCNVSDGATLYASLVGEGAQGYVLVLDGQEIAMDAQSESVVRRYPTAVSRRETVMLRKLSEDAVETPPQLSFRIVTGG
ncbi:MULTISPECIES: hypothetical protein [unclassified Brevundimonas]|uniref:hypothetical protein n=1 Tax=unclassified Brevundimonas TaxID=2622653 RepID=UPI003F938D3E